MNGEGIIVHQNTINLMASVNDVESKKAKDHYTAMGLSPMKSSICSYVWGA
jgi:hypothetical protein